MTATLLEQLLVVLTSITEQEPKTDCQSSSQSTSRSISHLITGAFSDSVSEGFACVGRTGT